MSAVPPHTWDGNPTPSATLFADDDIGISLKGLPPYLSRTPEVLFEPAR